ncbi:hypothetical protein BSL82_09140 [Tardibacter chloracetimidivorans]|uniref:peptidoglycan glycosyltransferase n=2 Tax=Tardibacter chloracetimidivorans TaxID=1921510 RepID=A0A1L3ZZL3_9SPHN|nr:hypothetical protein BSL82_09140 [Tardibacter chloracetimidivorans]
MARWRPAIIWTAAAGVLALATYGEMHYSLLQSAVFSSLARTMDSSVRRGSDPDTGFPEHGPYDSRLGYVALPHYLGALEQRGYHITAQARQSPAMATFRKIGGFPPYEEKSTAGLTLRDANGRLYYAARHPSAVYPDFNAVPPLVVNALLFIENRELLNPDTPRRNPAVEWDRLGRAVLGYATGGLLMPSGPGGSTIATQLEKMRHSPGGRTGTPVEKLRQMVSASMHAYRDGPDTMDERRQLVVDVLNSTPLAGRVGHGEVIGLGEGLALWFGADFNRANGLLRKAGDGDANLPEAGAAFRQVLALLIAQRRPSFYLRGGRAELEALTASYLRLMANAGVISMRLRDAALRAPLRFADGAPPPRRLPPSSVKAVNGTRFELMRMLREPSLYTLDRLDLTADSSLDASVQAEVTALLRSLDDPEQLKALGMTGGRLMNGDPAKVAYSFTLFERGTGANHPRIQTDSVDRPLDINVGTKLELGSTAKVRTLITYLDIIARLYEEQRRLGPAALARTAETGDPLSRWVAAHLIEHGDPGMAGMMQAAMERKYSASTGERFFTAGGTHRFANFGRHGGYIPVDKALQQSVNLVFIRMMRDIVDHEIARITARKGDMIADVNHPQRMVYLRRFADMEGQQFLRQFHRDYRGLAPPAILERVAERARYLRPRLAAAYRTVLPSITEPEFARLIDRFATEKPADAAAMRKLYDTYAPDRLSLADRAYVSGIHPLELWLAGHLYRHPGASMREIVAASADVRQESYGWLFKSSRIAAQNRRIRTLLEQEAFVPIHAQWKRMGYPFDRLVPSYATAIGTSGDRPDALAELMGIIVNHGVRLPTVRIERLRFAANTPYETIVEADPPEPVRVLRPEIAAVVRRALVDTVESGTARRASDSFHDASGAAMVVGGKTGTGDNRTDRYARGGRVIGSVTRSRTATFVFFIGDRWYGTVTAHVEGADAAQYRFTSALPTQLFKSLTPILEPLVQRPPTPARGRS